MNAHQKQLITFVGMPGSGKSAAVYYLSEKGIPKVLCRQRSHFDIKEVVDEITRLGDAGQHRVVIDGLTEWEEYKALKHAFPGELITIGVACRRHIRHQRILSTMEYRLTEEQLRMNDWDAIENQQHAPLLAAADITILNDGTPEDLAKTLDDIVEKLFVS